MNLLNIVMQSNLISNGCKLYYSYLLKLNTASKINNWKITNGKYKDHNFIIVKDAVASKTLNIGLTSIHNYKKILKSLGLIDTLKKFTTKTNQCKNNHFCQLTIISNTISRKLISKLLTFNRFIKRATFQKTYNDIITCTKIKLNNYIKNLHFKVRQTISKIKPSKISENNNSNEQLVQNILENNRVTFKKNDLSKYVELYEKSKDRFNLTCVECSNKYTYSPFNYFKKIFTTYKDDFKPNFKHNNYFKYNKFNNSFKNFQQRYYDYDKLEKLLNNLNTTKTN